MQIIAYLEDHRHLRFFSIFVIDFSPLWQKCGRFSPLIFQSIVGHSNKFLDRPLHFPVSINFLDFSNCNASSFLDTAKCWCKISSSVSILRFLLQESGGAATHGCGRTEKTAALTTATESSSDQGEG